MFPYIRYTHFISLIAFDTFIQAAVMSPASLHFPLLLVLQRPVSSQLLISVLLPVLCSLTPRSSLSLPLLFASSALPCVLQTSFPPLLQSFVTRRSCAPSLGCTSHASLLPVTSHPLLPRSLSSLVSASSPLPLSV